MRCAHEGRLSISAPPPVPGLPAPFPNFGSFWTRLRERSPPSAPTKSGRECGVWRRVWGVCVCGGGVCLCVCLRWLMTIVSRPETIPTPTLFPAVVLSATASSSWSTACISHSRGTCEEGVGDQHTSTCTGEVESDHPSPAFQVPFAAPCRRTCSGTGGAEGPRRTPLKRAEG